MRHTQVLPILFLVVLFNGLLLAKAQNRRRRCPESDQCSFYRGRRLFHGYEMAREDTCESFCARSPRRARRNNYKCLSETTCGGCCATNSTLFESATLGGTGQVSGISVNTDQFLGVRFEVGSTTQISAVGGHFQAFGPDSTDEGTLFAAIIALSSPTDYPDSADLSTSDVIATTTLTASNPSSEVTAPLSATLTAGFYALVFGSGLFGATSIFGAAPDNGSRIGSPTFFNYADISGSFNEATFNSRFFVIGGTDCTLPGGFCTTP